MKKRKRVQTPIRLFESDYLQIKKKVVADKLTVQGLAEILALAYLKNKNIRKIVLSDGAQIEEIETQIQTAEAFATKSNTKECTICHEEKKLSKFYKCRASPDGTDFICKDCHNKHKTRTCTICLKTFQIALIAQLHYSGRFYGSCDECWTKEREAIKKRNKEKVEQYVATDKTKKRCCRCHQEKPLSSFYKDLEKPDGLSYVCKDCYYIKKNKSRNELRAIKTKNKDPRQIAETFARHQVRRVVLLAKEIYNKNVKNDRSLNYLGCSLTEFIKYIENKFKPGMSWSNYGMYGWHLDHVKPLSKFNILIEDEMRKALHYTNLQPLWAQENLHKSNRFED